MTLKGCVQSRCGKVGWCLHDRPPTCHCLLQAYYIPWGDELKRWALTHPEYTQEHILMLITCIAEANGLKKKERVSLISQIQMDLGDLRSMRM